MVPITTPAAGCHPCLFPPDSFSTKANMHARTHACTCTGARAQVALWCLVLLWCLCHKLAPTPTLLSLLQCPGGKAHGEILGVMPQEPPSEVHGARDKVTLTSEWINVDGLMGRWMFSHVLVTWTGVPQLPSIPGV